MTDSERDLFYQLEKLTDAADEMGLEPALLLEGEIGSELDHSRMPAHQIALYLAGLPLMGVTIIPSTGKRASARIISRLEDGEPPDVRRVRGSPDDDHAARFVVEGFPGIGPSRAEDLLEHFGDVESVVTASRDELLEIEGVGPSTADTITDVRSRGV